jgi:acetyl-CoA carboxylase biotin carboxyl carrier protein
MASVPTSLADIPSIIDRLEKSRFNYLDIQWGDLRITLGDQAPAMRPEPTPTPAYAAPVQPSPSNVTPRAAVSAPAAAPAGSVATPADMQGTAVKAPMVGRFYARPEPGAAPFIQVGDRVTPDTTIGLIEVMKVFNAVSAGVEGEVLSILVEEGEFVEFDQPLACVRV